MLTVILPTAELARKLAKDLKTKVAAEAGWHVYNNMEQLMELRTATSEQCPFTCFQYHGEKGKGIRYWKGMLPQTDALLGRSLNIAIGVCDPGLSSGFGLTVKDDLNAVEQHAALFRQAAEKYLK